MQAHRHAERSRKHFAAQSLGIALAAISTSALIAFGAFMGVKEAVATPEYAANTVIDGIDISGLGP